MFQVLLNRLWKLFLVVIISLTMLVPGNNALAANFTRLIPVQIGFVGKIGMQPHILAVGQLNLRVKSLTNTSTKEGEVYIYIQETGQTVGPMKIAPGQVLPITLNTCFTNLVNVKFADIKQQYEGQKTISSATATTTPPPINYGLYKMSYELSGQGCP
ncbi:MAG: hypothetical protein KAF91_12250 [Nostoc sp. TH1S01]|nr:hypothetical protein [Nostoc sp. TH1S01]